MFENNLTLLQIKSVWQQWRFKLAGSQLLALLIGLGGLVLSLNGFYQFKVVADEARVVICDSPVLGTTKSNSTSLGTIQIDVAGAVVKPGLYQLNLNDRVAQAVAAAGGFTSQADKSFVAKTLNLAQVLTDEEKVYIPFANELQAVTEETTSSILAATNNSQLVSINQASLDELDSLPGIGEKRAQDIIAGRPYQKLDQLVDQDILTEGIFTQIKEFLQL